MSGPRSAGRVHQQLPLFEIVHTARLADRAFTAAFAQHGLAAGQFGVLAAVNDTPGITQAQIAQQLNVRPQTVARPITQLVEDLLLRAGTPRGQGGATPLYITNLGADRLDAAWPDVTALNTPDRLGLTPSDAKDLVRLLSKVRPHILAVLTPEGEVR